MTKGTVHQKAEELIPAPKPLKIIQWGFHVLGVKPVLFLLLVCLAPYLLTLGGGGFCISVVPFEYCRGINLGAFGLGVNR